jgi:hypothetical protein
LDHCENNFLKKSSKELCAKPKHRIVKNYGIENCTQIQLSKNLTPCRKIICPYENNCDSFIPPSEKSYVEKKENSALCKQTKFNSESINESVQTNCLYGSNLKTSATVGCNFDANKLKNFQENSPDDGTYLKNCSINDCDEELYCDNKRFEKNIVINLEVNINL